MASLTQCVDLRSHCSWQFRCVTLYELLRTVASYAIEKFQHCFHQKAVVLKKRHISKKKSSALCCNSGFRADESCQHFHTLPSIELNCPPGSNPTFHTECLTRFCTLHTFFMHLEKPLCSNSSFRAGGSCPRFHTLPSIGLPTRLESHYSCRHCLLVVLT